MTKSENPEIAPIEGVINQATGGSCSESVSYTNRYERSLSKSSTRDEQLDGIVDEILQRKRLGPQPTIEEFVGLYPDLEQDLRELFPALDLAERLRSAEPSPLPSHERNSTYRDPLTKDAHPFPILNPLDLYGLKILRVLGRGGMGVVYEASDQRLKRNVAVKMILASEHASPQSIQRFRREAEIVARLQHPNIVQIHEVGESSGYPYCVLEYVSGGTLAERISGERLPAYDAAKLMESLARAMQLAHSRNVVHRDLKPSNIMMTTDGIPKITDFGLARQLDGEADITHTGVLIGTPSFMTPEQASGHAHEVGPSGDIYSLGAILYNCITGQPPFVGKAFSEVLDQVRSREPTPPSRVNSNVPMDLETICLKCLRKEPENRYASAQELAEELSRFQKGEPILARPIGNVERSVRWMKRNPAVASLMSAVMALLVFLGVGGLFAGWIFSQQAREQMILAESENRARRLAEEEQDKAEIAAEIAKTESERAIQVTKFLRGLFEPRDQFMIGSMSIGFQKKQSALLANDLLKSGVEKLREPGGLMDRPVVRAELLHDIGAIYMGLGELGEARPLLEEALHLRRLHLPADHLDLARSIHAVADVQSISDSVAAVQLYTEAIDILKKNPAMDELELALFETRFGLFQWYLNGQPEEPKRILQHAYEIRRSKLGDNDIQTISTLMVLTMISVETMAKSDAMKMIPQILETVEKCEGRPEYLEFVKRMISSFQVGLLLGERAAIEPTRKTLEQSILAFGEDHFITVRIRFILADLLFNQRQDSKMQEESLQQNTKCLQSLQSWGVTSRFWEATIRFAIARCNQALGQVETSTAELRRTVELLQPIKHQIQNRHIFPHALCDLALALQITMDPQYRDEITSLEEEAYDYCLANPKLNSSRRGHTLSNVAHWRLFRGDYESCAVVAREAAEHWGKTPGTHVFEAEAHAMLYYALNQLGHTEEAEVARTAAQQISEAHLDDFEPSMQRARQLLTGTIPYARH